MCKEKKKQNLNAHAENISCTSENARERETDRQTDRLTDTETEKDNQKRRNG